MGYKQHVKEWDNVQISHPTQKEIQKVIKDLSVRPETLKLLGGNTET